MWRRDWRRSALIVGVCPPWPASPPGSQQRAIGLCTPFQSHSRRTLNPTLGVWNTESWVCACGSLTYTLKQNEGTLTDCKTGKERPTQGNKPSTSCVGSYLLVRTSSKAKVHSYKAKWGSKDCGHETAFPSYNHIYWKLWFARYRKSKSNISEKVQH